MTAGLLHTEVKFSSSGHSLKAGLDLGLWTLDSGLWTMDSGLWTLDSGKRLSKYHDKDVLIASLVQSCANLSSLPVMDKKILPISTANTIFTFFLRFLV